jgi:hypothetical protein
MTAEEVDWRSIRYDDLYDIADVPEPVEPIPMRFKRWMVFPGDGIGKATSVNQRAFADCSQATLSAINKELEGLRVKLVLHGLHRPTHLLAYRFEPVASKARVKLKNPWYNYVLVWGLGDYSPKYYYKMCMWCARISERYYGQKGIYMNLRKRAQRWKAKQTNSLGRKPT